MASSVRVKLNPKGFEEVLADPGLRDEMVRTAREKILAQARARAPRDSGFGASMLRAEPVFESGKWVVRVGVDQLAYYMMLHQTGTRNLPPDPFLTAPLEGK